MKKIDNSKFSKTVIIIILIQFILIGLLFYRVNELEKQCYNLKEHIDFLDNEREVIYDMINLINLNK